MMLILFALLLLAGAALVLAVLADAALRGRNAYRQNLRELACLERGLPARRRPLPVRWQSAAVRRPAMLCVAA